MIEYVLIGLRNVKSNAKVFLAGFDISIWIIILIRLMNKLVKYERKL